MDSELAQSLEAILMVAEEPIPTAELARVTGTDLPATEAVLSALKAEYDGKTGYRKRGFELRQTQGAWRFYSRVDFAPLVGQFVIGGRTAKLTRAALETLAVIAYRQPCSRAQVAQIRGVNSDSVIRNLLARELISEVDREDSGALRYATTIKFLEQAGFASLDELPPIAPHLPAGAEFEALTEEGL